MRRILAYLLAVLCCWLGPVSATPAHAAPARPVTAYTYDGHHNDSALTYTMTERGPPASNESSTAYDAVDRWSHDAAARPDRPAPSPIITYDPTALLVQSVGVVTTALEVTPEISGLLAAFQRSDVAAKSADEALAGVDDVLGGLSKGRSGGVRTVGSDAELGEVYGTLTRGGTPIDVPGYKGTWIERSDGIRVGLRDASKSGGRTIDIRYPDGTIRKVHIQ